MFERFGDGEDQFILEGAADDLHADGKPFRGKAKGDGSAGETGEIEPLRETHGVAIAGAWVVVSFAVTEGGRGRNRGEKNGDTVHLAQDFFAKEITLGTCPHELIERGGDWGGCD